jgi:hypothetical protein
MIVLARILLLAVAGAIIYAAIRLVDPETPLAMLALVMVLSVPLGEIARRLTTRRAS